jgi:hypothetical protein
MDISMKNLLHYNTTGVEYIKKALEIDECEQHGSILSSFVSSLRFRKPIIDNVFTVGNKDEAIRYYKLGIKELKHGLEITLKGRTLGI